MRDAAPDRLAALVEVARAVADGQPLGRVLDVVAARARCALAAGAADVVLADTGERFSAGSVQDHAGPLLAVPMSFGGRVVGHLAVAGGPSPTEDDERFARALAALAAAAVAGDGGEDALRRSVRAFEEQRRRWARDLHERTLQDLAAARILLQAAVRSPETREPLEALRQAVDLLGEGVGALRSVIVDMRPATLDDLGVQAALEGLAERVRRTSGLEVRLQGAVVRRLDPEVESTVYRFVQEALANVVAHADAAEVVLRISDHGHALDLEVHDDGRGFPADGPRSGSGLLAMRERLALLRGTLRVGSSGSGTVLTASIAFLPSGASA